MATKPTDLPTFATTPTEWAEGTAVDETKDVIKPSSAFRVAGWLRGKPIRQYMNWLLRNISQWLTYLQDAPASHADPSDIVSDVAAGDLTVLNRASAQPFTSEWDIEHAATVVALAVDGDYVYAATAGTVYAYDDAGNEIWSQATGFTAIADICTDGANVYVAHDSKITALARADGAVGDSQTVVGTPEHVCTDGVGVYWSDGSEVNAMDATDLSTGLWGPTDLTNAINDLATNGVNICAALAFGSSKSAQLVSCSAGAAGTTINLGSGGDCDTVCTDGEYWYAQVSGAGDGLHEIGYLLQSATQVTSNSISKKAIATNGRYVLAGTLSGSTGACRVVRPEMAQENLITHTWGASSTLNAVAIDSHHYYLAGVASSSKTLKAYPLPQRPVLLRRASTSDPYRTPSHGLLLPVTP